MVEPNILRNRISRIIAATRFPFIDQETWPPGRQTIFNDEIKRYAISTEIGVLYPSVVIADQDGSILEIGSVELDKEINLQSVPKWAALSKVVPFGREFKKLFIYVPKGREEDTKELLEQNRVSYDGIRGYYVENQSLKIVPYITRNDEYDHIVT